MSKVQALGPIPLPGATIGAQLLAIKWAPPQRDWGISPQQVWKGGGGSVRLPTASMLYPTGTCELLTGSDSMLPKPRTAEPHSCGVHRVVVGTEGTCLK